MKHMKHLTNIMRKLTYSIIAFLFMTTSIAVASPRAEIQALVKRYNLSDAKIGIAVERTNSGQLLYQFAKDRPLIPASNNKIFTAVAGLFTLPNTYRYTTTAYYNPNQLRNGTLNGSLVIEFTGDPTLTGGQLNNIIRQIKAKGINRVTGDVIAVPKTFSGPYIPEGWTDEDRTYCYGAPASSMTMNRNCFTFKLVNTTGNQTAIQRLGNTSNILFTNTTRLTPPSERRTCPFELTMTDRNQVILKGCVEQQAEFYFNLAIANPALKTLNTIEDFLKNNNIQVNGRVRIGQQSVRGLTQITQQQSTTILPLLREMLERSNNLYAETILRTVGYEVHGVGSTAIGTQSVKDIIRDRLKMNTSALVMYDGSGLSHLNHVTPGFIASFLTKTFNSPVGQTFNNSLPRSGVSGTIAYRMTGPLQGKVRAKTGTLSGVSALSGYVITKRNHRISFSIMLNDLKRSDRNNARRFQDQVVKVFYEYF